ncbi:hypothetical protein B0H14DRAFT_191835 [Mycena olivaceomarginata]|nr:hypothetical protein B0H14DRAFT_191835 [Mycena olivaceomarginata]
MASEEALLQVLVSPPRLDIQALASSVLRFFQIITKWKAEKQAIVDAIVKQYDGAIKISLDMAQTGYNFAEDAMTLSKLVAKRAVDEEQLRGFLAEMLGMADTAHGQASTMNEQFSTVRQSIFQIQREGPREKLLETPSGILQYPAELTKQVSRGSVPPDISATPLENASNDLISLATCVGTFVDWWGGVKMKLNSLQSSIRLIKLDGSNPLREQVVLERWTGLRDQYVQYQSTVGAITDYLPEGSPIAKRINGVPGDKEGDNQQTASPEVEEQHSNNEGNNQQTGSPEGEEQHSNKEGDNQQTADRRAARVEVLRLYYNVKF